MTGPVLCTGCGWCANREPGTAPAKAAWMIATICAECHAEHVIELCGLHAAEFEDARIYCSAQSCYGLLAYRAQSLTSPGDIRAFEPPRR